MMPPPLHQSVHVGRNRQRHNASGALSPTPASGGDGGGGGGSGGGGGGRGGGGGGTPPFVRPEGLAGGR